MKLSELIKSIPAVLEPAFFGSDVSFESLSYDSRQVFAGVIFVCLVGEKSDGHVYAAEAIKKGAVGFVINKDRASQFDAAKLPYIAVTNTRKALPYIAGAFYNHPSESFELIGITGTNGKTTVSYITAAIWTQAGEKTGVIGTVGAVVDGVSFPTHWTVSTTPESLDLQQFFSQMREEKVQHVAVEVTSIAIDQERTSALDFDTAIYTNLTQDHLDYHLTMDRYEAAKARLFLDYSSTTKPDFVAILNADDPACDRLSVQTIATGRKTLRYGLHADNLDYRASEIVAKADSTRFIVTESSGETYSVTLPIGGLFNVYNALGAIAATRFRGVTAAQVQLGLASLRAVPGRFEPVPTEGKEYHVLVDYAHTPDGLENVLKSARALAPKRLVVVFGCGGNRDRTKRPKMGKIAADLADVVIVTSDNPRKEDPDFIVAEIAEGIPGGVDGERIRIITDRREAITTAIREIASPGDLIVIAGKGHETYQIVGDQVLPFDDRLIAAEIISGCS